MAAIFTEPGRSQKDPLIHLMNQRYCRQHKCALSNQAAPLYITSHRRRRQESWTMKYAATQHIKQYAVVYW